MVLRVLIGVACVAVVGFVGVAAWDRYSAAKALQEAEDARIAIVLACSSAAKAYGVGKLTVDQANQLRDCKRLGIPTGLERLFP